MMSMAIEDWVAANLGDIVDIRTGKLDSNYAEENGGYPFFTCAPNPLRINDFAFDCEAILLAGNNADGIFHLNFYSGKFNAYQRTYVITVKDKNKLDLRYLYYYLHLSLNLLKDFSQGTSTKFLTMRILKDLEIGLPPFREQKKISKTLSDLDDKIKTNMQMNQTLETIGQAVFKRWFVDFEFPNEEGKPYKSSGGEMIDAGETGKEIPKGWKVGRIEDIADVVGGGTPSTKVESYFTNTGIHWLTPKDLSGFEGKFIDRGATDITEEGLKNSSAKFTPKGTILFTSRAPIGYIAIALNSITTNQGFKSLIPKNEMQTEYLYQYLRMITPYVQSISCGSTFGEISGKAMKGIEIVIPEKLIVEKFEEFMAPVNSRIINNIFGVRTLKEIRDSLLPRLMSGRIRVPVEERMADNRK